MGIRATPMLFCCLKTAINNNTNKNRVSDVDKSTST